MPNLTMNAFGVNGVQLVGENFLLDMQKEHL
jgi:hypothetical protein